MKTTFKILLIVFVAWACEKNDPLADQGKLTGNVVPFNLLAQMPDAAAGDTLVLRNVSWAVEDNIKSIAFFHRGFKKRNYEVKISIQVADANNTVYNMAATYSEDSIIIPSTPIATYPETGTNLNQYYQTQENAYVILHEFVVPEQYTLSKQTNQALILAMNDQVFNYFKTAFSVNLNRRMLLAVFPSLSPFNVTYFKFDENGNFTGELHPAGFEYFLNNITRERFNDFVKEATVVDNSRVTILTEALVEGSTSGSKSSRVFRVL
jgi:hypothetical protein